MRVQVPPPAPPQNSAAVWCRTPNGPFDWEPSIDDELVQAVADGGRRIFAELFGSVSEDFYYCTLATTHEGLRPSASAWSWQALDRAAAESDHPAQAREWMKWSYADGPYAIFLDEYFAEADEAFRARPDPYKLDGAERLAEVETRLASIEEAMRLLDSEGLFGGGAERANKVVLVEVVPPDCTNTDRALRLNSPGPMLDIWLAEAAEPAG